MKKSKIKINEEHFPRHIFLTYCRNCLFNMLEYADKEQLSSAKIDLKSEDEKLQFESFCKNTESMLSWLDSKGHKDTLYNLYYKHLFFSLIVDFSNYFGASIEHAIKGNINVAWSLLRKPLQETLAYIEWLYVDKDELISLMLNEPDVKKYEIIRKKEKIKQNIKKIPFYSDEQPIDMFEFRYSYDTDVTINGILQATNHLITTRPNLKTSPSGLNFVFPDNEINERNIGFYYTTIPYIMLYAMNIMLSIFNDFAKVNNYTRVINQLNLNLKNFRAMPMAFEKTKEILLLDKFAIYCPHCGKKYSSDKKWITFAEYRFRCSRCFNTINTHKYIFDYEKVEFIEKDKEQ